MSGTVSTRWYFSDWMSDPGVRISSLAARGLWIDLLAVAGSNKGRDYGFVMLNRRVPSTAEIATLVGASTEEIETLLAELARNGVYNRDKRKAIYCRRMVRSAKYQTNGRLGGTPEVVKSNQRPGLVPPEKRFRRKSFTPEERQQIFDRFNGKCHWCGTDLITTWSGHGDIPINYMHIDHKVALCDGGNNEFENLVASCRECNGQRSLSLSDCKDFENKKRPPYPIPKPEPKPKESTSLRSVARGTRLPSDWSPTVAGLVFAKTQLHDDDIQTEVDKFRDHWWASAGRNAVKANWDSAWRNWCRKAVEIRGEKNATTRRDQIRGRGDDRQPSFASFAAERADDASRGRS